MVGWLRLELIEIKNCLFSISDKKSSSSNSGMVKNQKNQKNVKNVKKYKVKKTIIE